MDTVMSKEIRGQSAVAKDILSFYQHQASSLLGELKSKKQVYLVGTGASLNACRTSQYAFAKYAGFVPICILASEVNSFICGLEPDSIAILVSQSGNNTEICFAAEQLTARGISIWAVTNKIDSPLAVKAARVLDLRAGKEYDSATKSCTATILLLYMLACGSSAKAASILEQIPGQIDGVLSTLQEQSYCWAENIMEKDCSIIVGVGMQSHIAVQCALLYKEKTCITTEGMNDSDFCHGAVEVIRPGFPVFLIACGGEAAKRADELAAFLLELDSTVYFVGDRSIPSVKPQNSIILPEIEDEALSHILPCIPFQLISDKISYAKNINLEGIFRYIPKLVKRISK